VVHFRLEGCHVTTVGGVGIIRWAKSRGVRVTAEVTPHHLLLTDDVASSYDPIYKVNPPLRTEADVHALRAGLADGTIDVVATDHAPHPAESKECEWQAASFGMIGLETDFAIVYETMVKSGLMSWEQLVERMSITPAKIANYVDHGHPIARDSKANLVVVNPNRSWKVDKDRVVSKSRNTPFHSLEFSASVEATFFNGNATLLDSELVGGSDDN